MASITKLPRELWDIISPLLEDHDICSLRQTCQALAYNMSDDLGRRAFTELYLALTSSGLELLQYLAGHGVFRNCVKSLWILPTLFDARYNLTISGMCQGEDSTAWHQNRSRSWHPTIWRATTDPCPTHTRQLFKKRHRSGSLGADLSAVDLRFCTYELAVLDHLEVLFGSQDGATSSSDATDADSNRTPLFNALNRCLPRFQNLRAIGLRNYFDHGPVNVKGVRDLRTNLEVDPLNPCPPSQPKGNPLRYKKDLFQMGLFQSHVFQTLMTALETTGTKITIERLETDGLMTDGAQFISLEKVLLHHEQNIRHLSMILCNLNAQGKQRDMLQEAEAKLFDDVLETYQTWKLRTCGIPDSDADTETDRNPDANGNPDGDVLLQLRQLRILTSISSTLETLNLSIRFPPITIPDFRRYSVQNGTSEAHFDFLARHCNFHSLRTLSLSNIVTTEHSFLAFLSTAQPTLRTLRMSLIDWTSNPVFGYPSHVFNGRNQQLADEAARVCQQVTRHLQNNCPLLQDLCFYGWYFHGHAILFQDQFGVGPGVLGSQSRVEVSYEGPGTGAKEGISFNKWIGQISFNVPRGPKERHEIRKIIGYGAFLT